MKLDSSHYLHLYFFDIILNIDDSYNIISKITLKNTHTEIKYQ